jgi:hypothetical protein
MSDTSRESSLSFSIRELEEIERERVRTEQGAEEKRRLSAEARRVRDWNGPARKRRADSRRPNGSVRPRHRSFETRSRSAR